jgi:adenylosuccinate synthase
VDFALKNPDNALRVHDLAVPLRLKTKLEDLRYWAANTLSELGIELDNPHLRDEMYFLLPDTFVNLFTKYQHFYQRVNIVPADSLSRFCNKDIVFEGSQGVLLDEDYGFHPYTTWSHCDFRNAENFLKESEFRGWTTKVGITRTYMTRHGPGPLPTETDQFDSILSEQHNKHNPWQMKFRHGWLDYNLLKYAIKCIGGIDSLAVTHYDVIDEAVRDIWPICDLPYLDSAGVAVPSILDPLSPNDFVAREARTKALLGCTARTLSVHANDYLSEMVSRLMTPISVVSRGPRTSQKRFYLEQS